jgi:hypothetical protein
VEVVEAEGWIVALDATPLGDRVPGPAGIDLPEACEDGPIVPEDLDEAGGDAEPPAIDAPHSPQKRSPASAGAEQDGHVTASEPPH